MKNVRYGLTSFIFCCAVLGASALSWAQGQTTTFSAMGDVPYSSGEYSTLQQQMTDHNKYSPAKFQIHVGDIKSGGGSCTQSIFSDVANILKTSVAPFYIIPGDNETTDCSNPSQAMGYWYQYFTNFEQNFCGAPYTEHQSGTPENFAFMLDGVLYIGIHLVGGGGASTSIQQIDAAWVDQHFTAKKLLVRAAVVFSQAGPGSGRDTFFDAFEVSAAAFGKPVLFLHGDGHSWIQDNPFPLPNTMRIEVEQGGSEDPVEITVSMNTATPSTTFIIKRNPWTSNTIVNMPPCANAGADQTTASTSVNLSGSAVDDGDPASGSLTKTWSKVSGPGTVTFGNANALTTTASFSLPGAYVLRLTANDSQLQGSDDIQITVEGAASPVLTIDDVIVNEGHNGTTDAIFTVSLAGSDGSTVTVDFQTNDGTATSGDDYAANSGTLTFSGSTTSQTITVAINGDTNDEGQDEIFFVNLSNAANAGIADAQGQGTIVNDDAPVPPAAPINLKAITTGTSTTTLTWSDQSNNEDGFKIERKTGSGAFAEIATAGANANLYNDSGLNANTVYTYQVRAFTSSANSAYSNSSATETGSGIVANPSTNIALNRPGSASTTNSSYPVTNAFDGNTSSTYWRSNSVVSGVAEWLRVDLGSVQTVGRAVIRWYSSYFAKSYELQISNNDVDWTTVYSTTSGVAGNADFSFTPALARYVRVYMTLNNGSTYRIYEFEIYSGPTPPPLPTLAINDVSMNEGNSGTTDAVFTVSLTGASVGTATVDYQIAAGTATEGDDYTPSATSGTLTFSGATTSQTITVAINGEVIDEAQDETFFVNLSNPTNAAITDAQGLGTIVNDDAPVPPAAPANLRAMTTGTSTVDLTWSDQSNNEDGFKIERKTGTGAFAEIASPGADAISFNDTGLDPSTVYTYQVRAFKASASSAYSNTSSTETGSGMVASPGVNVALSKSTSASTTNSSYPTPNAVDGNTSSTYWRSNSVVSGVAEWLRVDLGSVQTVGRAVIRWYSSYFAKSYELQISNNDVDWTTVYSTTSGVAGNADFSFTPALARYVRVYMTLNNGSTYRIYEFEIYSGPTPPPLPTLAINDVSMNEGNSGTTDAVFTVSLTGASVGTATVDYQIAAGTATEGDDYTPSATSGTLTFSGATTSQTITVAINGDVTDEAQDETFFVNLSNATNATITDAQGQGTIVNDDAPVPPAAPTNLQAKTTGTSTVDLTWSDQSNNEDGFKIERKTGTGAFAEIASPGADAISFNDTGLDPSTVYTYQVRAFKASASSAYSNTSSTETGSGIVANPSTNIALNRPGSASTTNSSYPVTNAFDGNTSSTYWRSNSVVSGVAEWLRVDLGSVQTVGRAVIRWYSSYFAKSYELQISNNDVDWTTVYSTTSGVAGNADFSFTPALARYVRIYMTLNNGSTYRIYEFEIYSGPPPPPLPTLAINDVSMNEGNSGTTDAVFTVSLTGASVGTATVDYQIAAGTATEGDDYTPSATSGTLTFSGATTTQTITVAINGDVIDEAQDETFFVNLSNATNAAITDAQGLGTIINDDAPAPPSAPTNLAANATSSSDIALTWQDNSTDETGFKIERKTGSGSFSEIATVGAEVASYNDMGLTSNTTYTYRVRANNLTGDSNYSNEAAATTQGSTSANLALNKPTTALSTYSSKPTTNAVDGDANTYWRSGSLANPPISWLRVDLGGALMVARVVINWRDDYYAKTYEVQVSSDDVNWTPAASGSGAVGIQTLTFTATTARYVRLYFTVKNRSSYRVAEFEVYSSSGATTKRNANESEVAKSAVVMDYALAHNFPNPFNPNTQIRFALPQESHVTIKVYSLGGAEVRTLVDDRYTAGTHAVTFNAGNLPSGAYFYVMQAGNVRLVRQLMLVK